MPVEDLITQLSAALTPVLGALCGWLAAKLKSASAKTKADDEVARKQQAALAALASLATSLAGLPELPDADGDGIPDSADDSQ